MTRTGFRTREIGQGIWQITDIIDNRAYLVVGRTSALLVDSCGGCGDLGACVWGLTQLPVTVALTHGHYDHMAGSYWFGEARISPADGGCWDLVEEHASRVLAQLVEEGIFDASSPFATRDGRRPDEVAVNDGEVFDLGGRTVRAVSLPGHTAGSMGYVVEDARILLSGDAVTPIMCLFFEESLGIDVWRATLAKMADLPIDRFYTGHHDDGLSRDALASFDAAAAFALSDRGVPWQHARLSEFRGIMHLCPCATLDVDSPDFRAVIEPWHELPPRTRRRRGRRAQRES